MKFLIFAIALMSQSFSFAASTLLPIKGKLSAYDKKYASVSNLNGTYEIPVEYFSDIKKISIGSDVEISLDENQNKKVKFTAPKEHIIK